MKEEDQEHSHEEIGVSKWHLDQLKKDQRYLRLTQAHRQVDFGGEQFQEQFKDYDEIADTSMKIYMTD